MNIWLLEDDHLQAESILETVKDTLRVADSNIVWLKTEHQFYERLEMKNVPLPDLAILDVMVRWTDALPNMPTPPEEVRLERHYRAGIRCYHKLKEKFPHVAVVFYTILSENDLLPDLPPDVKVSGIIITKSGNSKALAAKLQEFAANLR